MVFKLCKISRYPYSQIRIIVNYFECFSIHALITILISKKDDVVKIYVMLYNN